MLNQLVFSLFFLVSLANAETHTIAFDNRCGFGTPTLIQGGNIMTLVDNSFTIDGPFSSAIAYLQTSKCGYNGEDCLMVEMNLNNPTCAGCGSSTDLTLIPPHAFSVPTAFEYYNGCNGTGATCTSGTCDTAFFDPNDNQVQVACQTNNVNLLITFCGNASSASDTISSSASSSKASTAKTTSTITSATTTSATTTSAHSETTASVAPSTLAADVASTTTVFASGGASTAVCKNRRTVKSQALQAHRRRVSRLSS